MPRTWIDYQNLFSDGYTSQAQFSLRQWLYGMISVVPEVASWQLDGSKYLGFCGDSIMTVAVNDIPGKVAARIAGANLVNAAVGNTIWQHAPAHLTSVLASNPHTVVLAYGINDVSQDNSFDYIEDTEWPAILSLLDSSNVEKVIVCGITPTSFFNDSKAAISRTWNGYYEDWCDENGFVYVDNREWLGQIRPSTGQYDDMKPLYSGDTVHPSELGAQEYAKLVLPKMLSSIIPGGIVI